MSADELLVEFRDTGRQEPFEEVVRRYGPMVFSTCYRVTRDRHDAEDAVQAVFLSLAVQVKANREIRYIGAWLQQVGHRLSLDIRRSKKRRLAREFKHHEIKNGHNGHNGHAPDASNGADLDEMKMLVTEELGQLPTKYRIPLVLFYFGGMSREQISRELNCNSSTLGVRLHRGREMLAKNLAKRGIEISGAMLTVILASSIRSAIGDVLVYKTSAAALHMAAGGRVAEGFASSHIITLARGAAHSLLMAKVKTAVAVALFASAALAAGAQAVYHTSLIDLVLPQRLNFDARDLIPPLLKSVITAPQAAAPRAIQPKSSDSFYALGSIKIPEHHLTLSAIPASEIQPPANSIPPKIELTLVPPQPRSAPPSAPFTLHIDAPAAPVALSLKTADLPVVAATVSDAPASSDDSGPSAGGGGSTTPTAPSRPAPVMGPVFAFAQPSNNLIQLTPQPTIILQPSSTSFRNSSTTSLRGKTTTATVASASSPLLSSLAKTWTVTDSTLRGYGVVDLPGVFDENGQVIAEFGTLDLSHLQGITNSIDNPAHGGFNGWYAVSSGKLVLPSISVTEAHHAYTWGETAGDPTIDLVNSLRFIAGQVDAASNVTISLISPASPDVPAFSDPNSLIGLWQLTGAENLHDLLTTARYDDALAQQLGVSESNLQLWAYTDSWHEIPATLDTENNLITGNIGSPTYFAIVIPEPATLALTCVIGSSLLLRRRRRS